MKGTRAWERRKSTSICLVPWRLKCLENGKHDFCERSTSIAKWTMGTYSVDAKDAGKGEREKRFFFFYLSRDTYQNRSNRSRIAHESARTRLSTRQDVDSNDPSSNVTNCSF